MTVQQQYTASQQARAASLLETSKTWTRGTRKSDGLAFVLFPSTKPGHAYYATASKCSCSGFFYRGQCSHELAVRLWEQRQDEIDAAIEIAFMELALSKRGDRAGAALTRYQKIWGDDD